MTGRVFLNQAQRTWMNPDGPDRVTIWVSESRLRHEETSYVVKGDEMIPLEEWLRMQGQTQAEAGVVQRSLIPKV